MLSRSEEQFRRNQILLGKRRKAAQALQRREFVPELKEVLDFFEKIGVLMRKGALDQVWMCYYNWAIRYWILARKYVSEVRAKDRTIWMDYEYLYDKLIAIETRKSKRSPNEILPTEASLKRFLSEESIIA
jgi:hypothetical protein